MENVTLPIAMTWPTGCARKIFSLIELLVVVAIIGVLAALLLPALQKAKQAGVRVACLGNIRQQGFAWNSYWADNNGVFPDGWPQRCPPNAYNIFWFSLFNPYIGSDNLWRCPAHIDPAWKKSYNHLSYGYNAAAFAAATLDANPNLRVDRLKEPERDVLMADSEQEPGCTEWTCIINSPKHIGSVSDPSQLGYRHLLGVNILWVDGHADWHSRTETIRENTGAWNVPAGSGWYGPHPWFRDPIYPCF